MKYLILSLFMFLQITMDCISQEPCFTPKGYSQSIFRIKLVKPGIYKTDLIQLGEDYINPCIKEIVTHIDSDKIDVNFGFLGESTNIDYNVSLLKRKKGLFKRKKNR